MDVTLPDMWRASVRHAPVFAAPGAQLLKKPRCGQRPASRMSRSQTDGWSPSSPGRGGRWHWPPGGWMWRGRRPRSMPGQPARRRAGFTPRCQPIPPMAISTRATAILHADGMANAIVAATGRRLRDLPFALTETGTAGRAGRRHLCEPSPGLGQPESAPRPDLRAAMGRRAAKDIPPLTGRRAVVTVPGRLGGRSVIRGKKCRRQPRSTPTSPSGFGKPRTNSRGASLHSRTTGAVCRGGTRRRLLAAEERKCPESPALQAWRCRSRGPSRHRQSAGM